jgi:hypothetical protein
MEIDMSSAMILLKNTPKGLKLITATDINQEKFKPMKSNDPMASRAREVMDFLIVKAKLQFSHRYNNVTITELFDALVKQYGDGFFDDCKILNRVGNIPARLLIVAK